MTKTYKLHVDVEAFDRKPIPNEAKTISNRITNASVNATPEQLAKAVGAEGRTMLLGLMNGKRNNTNLISQQVIALDFDNEAEKGVRNEGIQYTTIEQVLSDPFITKNASFLYKTFSFKDDWHKFRIVFFLDEPITNTNTISALYSYLIEKYNGTDDLGNLNNGTLDIGTKDSARLFYGGIEAIEINYSNTLNVEALNIKAPEPVEYQYSNDNSELDFSHAIDLVKKYADRNQAYLDDYDFYINSHNVIRNALNTGEINKGIAEASVMILANGNAEYEIENMKKLRSDRSTPRIKKPFKEWFNDGRNEYEYKEANPNIKTIKESVEEEREKKVEQAVLNAQVNANKLKAFYQQIDESTNTPPTPTGFKNVDKILDGGIREGLHVLGAISSLGKTTLVMQMVDQVAEYGRDVLVFSLEMGTNELIAKSISRLSLYQVLDDGQPKDNAKSVNEILTGSKYANYSEYEKNVIKDSTAKYAEYSNNIYIHEGTAGTSALDIKAIAEKHVELTGNTPIIVIDYLQILQPLNDRATDKMNTDASIKILKQLSRDLKTTVLAISSFNRDNYNNPVSMVSFKESGGIEYSADIVLGLQFQAFSNDSINNKDIDFDEEKEKEPREVELVVLKNRNGETGKRVKFDYHAKYNMYEETEESFITASYKAKKRKVKQL